VSEPAGQAALEEAPQADSPFVVVMKLWARWMTLTDRQQSGGWAHPQDVKEFMRAGEAVDTMINDLPSSHRWAIYRAYGIATVWRFPALSLADVVIEAEDILTPRMQRNVDVRRYFVDSQ
jgi:hypothetical protein